MKSTGFWSSIDRLIRAISERDESDIDISRYLEHIYSKLESVRCFIQYGSHKAGAHSAHISLLQVPALSERTLTSKLVQ
jgi:hypothetical protein